MKRRSFVTIGRGEEEHRVFVMPTKLGTHRATIVAAESLADLQDLLEDTRYGFLVAIPLGLFLAWLGGSALARRSLAPGFGDDDARCGDRCDESPRTTSGRESARRARPPRDGVQRPARAARRRLRAAASLHGRRLARAAHPGGDHARRGRHRPVAGHPLARGLPRRARGRSRRGAPPVPHRRRPLPPRARRRGAAAAARCELYLDELVSDCVRAVRSLAPCAVDVRVHCSMEPLPCPPKSTVATRYQCSDHAFRGDEELLRRLLVNLLDNAIKHAPAGSTVDVDLDERRARPSPARHRSRPGIPAEARSHVFERFFRADASHARDAESETGGAGLGLAIARWVAEAHGGSLSLVDVAAGGNRVRSMAAAETPPLRNGARRSVILRTGGRSSVQSGAARCVLAPAKTPTSQWRISMHARRMLFVAAVVAVGSFAIAATAGAQAEEADDARHEDRRPRCT